MRRHYGIHKKRMILLRFIAVLVILIIGLKLVDNEIRPIIINMSKVQAQAASTEIINKAVESEMDKNKVAYEDLVHIVRKEDKTVTSIESDIAKINDIKAKITLSISDAFKDHDNYKVSIPIGTLTGQEILTGRGPDVNMKVKLAKSIVSDIQSTFEEAGINQTKHRLVLNLDIEVYVVLPGYNSTTKVNTNFVIAESIIVGTVPGTYTNVNGDKSDTLGLINDYPRKTDK